MLDPELIERFLAGECSPEEQARVQAWAGHRRSGVPVADAVRDAMYAMQGAPADPEVYKRALRARLGLTTALTSPAVHVTAQTPAQPKTQSRRPGATMLWPRRVIATAGLVASAAVVWLISTRYVAAPNAERVYQTPAGVSLTVALSDGSSVLLSPNSRLSVPSRFGDGDRAVTLSGDAYFTVSHTEGVPFVVHTGRIDTRVLGTAFGISYRAHDDVRVAVASGKVSAGWSHDTHAVTLTEGMIGRLSDSTAVVATMRDLGEHVDWAMGQLVFAKVPLAEVLTAMSGWYGLEFQLTDSSIARGLVTTSLDAHDRALALRALALLADADLTYRNGTDGKLIVTLHPSRHAQVKPARSGLPDFSPTPSFGR